jgi:hypothetical protein
MKFRGSSDYAPHGRHAPYSNHTQQDQNMPCHETSRQNHEAVLSQLLVPQNQDFTAKDAKGYEFFALFAYTLRELFIEFGVSHPCALNYTDAARLSSNVPAVCEVRHPLLPITLWYSLLL